MVSPIDYGGNNNEQDNNQVGETEKYSFLSSKAGRVAIIIALVVASVFGLYMVFFTGEKPAEDGSKTDDIVINDTSTFAVPKDAIKAPKKFDEIPLDKKDSKKDEKSSDSAFDLPSLPSLPSFDDDKASDKKLDELPKVVDLSKDQQLPELPSLPQIPDSATQNLPTTNTSPQVTQPSMPTTINQTPTTTLPANNPQAGDGAIPNTVPSVNSGNNSTPDPRRSSSIFLSQNATIPPSASSEVQSNITVLGDEGLDAVTAVKDNVVKSNKIMNLENTIAQGKLVDAVLETAINTDLPGTLRAIVSRDVYAERGNNVLIPKGSRLIGSYNSGVVRGQRRIMIIWNRIIRPDGISISISSQATDQFGRTGVQGDLDNKYFEILGNSLLISLITIAGAIAAESITGSHGTTTSISNGASSVQNQRPSDLAIIQSTKTIGDTAKNVIGDLIKTGPTLRIMHGTRLSVFVNQDLIIPSLK